MSPLVFVCDLDNTLYNWVDSYIPAMREMIQFAADILSCDPQRITDDLRAVHQAHGTIERPFSLLETDVVADRLRGRSPQQRYEALDMAFYAFNWTRKKHLELYPGVREVFEVLRSNSMQVVGFTDANAYGVIDRLRRLELVEEFSSIFCGARPATTPPNPDWAPDFFETFPEGVLVELASGQRKPDPVLLAEIIERVGGQADDCIYAGDSLHRDMMMARRAGVRTAWAKYGTNIDEKNRELLEQLSHWTDDEIELDRRLRQEIEDEAFVPDCTMHASFLEVFGCVR